MFGETNVVSVVDLRHAPEEESGSVEEAVNRLLDVTEHRRSRNRSSSRRLCSCSLSFRGTPNPAPSTSTTVIQGFGSG